MYHFNITFIKIKITNMLFRRLFYNKPPWPASDDSISGVMVSILTSTVVDQEFELCSRQTKD